ncbi:MAG: PepSY domain-containing protein, partial [Myxococcales bacterium]|nr:PepSY domain-containing protein [Myxococcales bacterium]
EVDPHDVAFDLLDALAIADEHEPGGISIEAELTDDDGDGLVYDVDRVVGEQTREILIDADTGEVVATRVDPEDQAEGRMQGQAIATSQDGVTLERAIQTALDTLPGTAVSAETEVEDGVILVVLLEGETSHALAIDLDTGVVVDTAAEPAGD